MMEYALTLDVVMLSPRDVSQQGSLEDGYRIESVFHAEES